MGAADHLSGRYAQRVVGMSNEAAALLAFVAFLIFLHSMRWK
jgi:hypothetical protein